MHSPSTVPSVLAFPDKLSTIGVPQSATMFSELPESTEDFRVDDAGGQFRQRPGPVTHFPMKALQDPR
jgi:hypothetical protein